MKRLTFLIVERPGGGGDHRKRQQDVVAPRTPRAPGSPRKPAIRLDCPSEHAVAMRGLNCYMLAAIGLHDSAALQRRSVP